MVEGKGKEEKTKKLRRNYEKDPQRTQTNCLAQNTPCRRLSGQAEGASSVLKNSRSVYLTTQ